MPINRCCPPVNTRRSANHFLRHLSQYIDIKQSSKSIERIKRSQMDILRFLVCIYPSVKYSEVLYSIKENEILKKTSVPRGFEK